MSYLCRALVLPLALALIGACEDGPDADRYASGRRRTGVADRHPGGDGGPHDASDSVVDGSTAPAASAPARRPTDAASDGGEPRRSSRDSGSNPERSAGDRPSDPDAADGGADDCITRITYGSAWFRPTDHPDNDWDEVPGLVTWDGRCEVDAAGNSAAQLSNGWRPVFSGRNSCLIALDALGSCAPADECKTRVYYGENWIRPEDHPSQFDDVSGVLTTNDMCVPRGDRSSQILSNGWEPYFTGGDGCALALRYSQCGGLFANPVIDSDCPDPGVLRADDQYVMACTSGGPEYPIRTSPDLVHWTLRGSIFTQASMPRWAAGDFWAPEIHRVGDRFVAYFSARHTDGDLAIGAAWSTDVLGPYADIGAPLVRDDRGAIDAHQFEAPDGTRYLLWKVDGNASGTPTSIEIQPLTADGLARTGSATTLLRNTLPWEGDVIEGPWLIFADGHYYLFYSGSDYASSSYALGVARATAVTGPYTKHASPILESSGEWAGPGHGSVIRSPDGGWVHVFHAWQSEHVGQSPPGRLVLLARIGWADGWPTMLGAPSSLSQPLP